MKRLGGAIRNACTDILNRNKSACIDPELLIQDAEFPYEKTLESFEYGKVLSLSRDKTVELSQNGYIDRKETILMIGRPGLGKTHLAIALGTEACKRGYPVKYFTASRLVNELLEAEKELSINRFMKQLERYELLVIDNLGYTLLTERGASLLFEVIDNCYEQSSVIVASNLEFAHWTDALINLDITEAILDRLVHHCHLLEFRGRSYRTRQHRTKIKKDGKTHKG